MLGVIILNVVKLNVIKLNVVNLSAVMLNDIMLNDTAQFLNVKLINKAPAGLNTNEERH
jgi:hypothetical protein